VKLLPRRARPFYGRHPWVFPGAIAETRGTPADGSEVDLVSHADHFIARGFYNAASKIRVRLYSWDADIPLDREFFKRLLTSAIALRRDVLGLVRPGGAERLVFSEADGLSGLTVDRYDRWLTVQFTSLALAQRRELLAELLVELLQPAGIYLRTERGIGKMEGLAIEDGVLWGQVPTEPIEIEEHGLRLLVPLTVGQKTGYYLDQRDNRQAVARYAPGRRVLDAFCYTGGFGLHAAKAAAQSVLGVDVSAPALELARVNAERNGLSGMSFLQGDVFERLAELQASGERFALVVLDPPKFARSRSNVDEALRGYRRLIELGIRLLDSGGILTVACCSGLVTSAMLEELLSQLAAEERRHVQLLERRGPSPDHPVSMFCPESDYLKCLICRVS
jgi:23S rRNA (cytosine1962-C5)-methyltransferase